MDITFGTDGWRAVLEEDFNEHNVQRVTLAIGKYVSDKYGYEKPILVGFDPRNKAEEFAFDCANILKNKGFTVYLSDKVIPTPVLAYNAKLRNACAVMFTASHNPPEYLGMKFIPDYAGPAVSEITDAIVANIDKNYDNAHDCGILHKIDFSRKYYEHLNSIIDYDVIKNIKTNIIFDGLYSASIGYFDYILKTHNIHFESFHMFHDINFGGGMPDPKPRFLKELREKVINSPNSIGLANDGDADRFGVINEKGEYVSPNEIIAILLKHLVNKGYKGALVKTVGSSILLDVVAKKLGINVIETPVGFKYVGEAMRKNRVIIGGEESGGLSIYGHIPEKDGILANLLILEAMAANKKSLIELQEEIYNLVGAKFYTDRTDLKLDDRTEVDKILEKCKQISEVGKYQITNFDFKDGAKFMLGESSKILVRPSGTEPLLRIYFESDDKDKLDYLKTNFII